MVLIVNEEGCEKGQVRVLLIVIGEEVPKFEYLGFLRQPWSKGKKRDLKREGEVARWKLQWR